MANPKESKLQIIRDIYQMPTSIRFARVTSPLLGLEEARREARKFINQHNPDNLSCEDVVTLEDPKGKTIGGAIIWEASWIKEQVSQNVENALFALREALEQEQISQPGHYPIN